MIILAKKNNMQNLYSRLLLAIMLFAGSLHVSAIDAVYYVGTGQPAENRLIALTIAGIVNRDEPRLYLVDVYQTWSYNQTDVKWREIYEQYGNASFTHIASIQGLIDHFQDFIEGAVTYDPALTYGNFQGQNFRWQGEVAAMLGGLTNCIPLPYNNAQIIVDRPDSVWVPDPFHGKDPIRVSAKLEDIEHPWNNPSLSQEERYFSILDWALENLLDRTHPRRFYLREITDWAISQRMFQLNLAGTETLNFYSLSDEKAEKIEQVMTYLRSCHPDEIFHVYGWMRPEPLVQWISGWGGSFHETLLGNLSWHHIFPAQEDFVYDRASSLSPDDVVLENKHYVVFLGSEGDAGNWVAGFQAGAWHSPLRGQVPVGWGWNLHMFDQFPFMAQYYYSTATENDGFMAVTTPLGYAYPDMFPDGFLPDAIDQTTELLQRFDIPTVYAYKHYNGAGVSTYRGIQISNNYNFHKLGSFAESTGTGLTFLFDPALLTQRYYTNYGGLLYNHVNDETFYANVVDLNNAANRVIQKLKNKPTPNFLLAGYQRFRQDGITINANNPADITLPRLQTLMQLIESDPDLAGKVEFVTPERFTWLLHRMIATADTREPLQPHAGSIRTWVEGGQNLAVEFYQQTPREVQVRIFDLSGRLIRSQTLQGTTGLQRIHVSLGNLPAGMYIVTLGNSELFSSGRFIIP